MYAPYSPRQIPYWCETPLGSTSASNSDFDSDSEMKQYVMQDTSARKQSKYKTHSMLEGHDNLVFIPSNLRQEKLSMKWINVSGNEYELHHCLLLQCRGTYQELYQGPQMTISPLARLTDRNTIKEEKKPTNPWLQQNADVLDEYPWSEGEPGVTESDSPGRSKASEVERRPETRCKRARDLRRERGKVAQ